MIAWYVGVILFFFGEMFGIVIMAILAGGTKKRPPMVQHQRTARRTGRKD